jgi:hypothetical protein
MHRHDAATVSYTEISATQDQAVMRHICDAPCTSSKSSCYRIRVRQ